jgi:small subunit ribosomal protein S6
MTAAVAVRKLAREYELIYILRPTVAPADAKKVAERVAEVVERRGAKLTKVDNWGKRRLAYPIEKHTRGIFIFVKIIGFNDVVAEIERNLRNFDTVIRYQTVVLEQTYDLAQVVVDPEEVQFREIEVGQEEEPEPTFEERLGLTRASRHIVDVDEGEGDDEAGDLGDADDDVVPPTRREAPPEAATTEDSES